MSFAIQSINPENFVEEISIQTDNNNVIWLRATAVCDGTGLTRFFDPLSRNTFTFNENDGILTCMVYGTRITGTGGSAVIVGSSLTDQGAIVVPFVTTTGTAVADVASTNAVDTILTAAVNGLFLTVSLGAGLTAADFECLVLVWRQ